MNGRDLSASSAGIIGREGAGGGENVLELFCNMGGGGGGTGGGAGGTGGGTGGGQAQLLLC